MATNQQPSDGESGWHHITSRCRTHGRVYKQSHGNPGPRHAASAGHRNMPPIVGTAHNISTELLSSYSIALDDSASTKNCPKLVKGSYNTSLGRSEDAIMSVSQSSRNIASGPSI